jgi:hypothetical protein
MKLWMPRPLTLFLLTFVVVVAGVVLRVGIRARRQIPAVQELSRYGIVGTTHRFGPNWLRNLASEERMLAVDEIDIASFYPNFERFKRMDREGQFAHRRMNFGPRGHYEVDDFVLARIRDLPELTQVNLGWTNVSDAGMEHLCSLPSVEHLKLCWTDVSDASVPQLKRLRNLKELWLQGTRVSAAGVKELEQAIPGLRVVR